MKSLVRFGFALPLVALTGLSAEAGLPQTAPVSITQSGGTGTVRGAMGSTRHGSGTTQYLGTWAQLGFPDPPGSSTIDTQMLQGGIVAKDATGATVNCMFSKYAILSYLPQLAVVNSDSFLTAGFEPITNSSSNDPNQYKCNGLDLVQVTQCCNSLTVSSSSYDQPK